MFETRQNGENVGIKDILRRFPSKNRLDIEFTAC